MTAKCQVSELNFPTVPLVDGCGTPTISAIPDMLKDVLHGSVSSTALLFQNPEHCFHLKAWKFLNRRKRF
jgi:hypothetical protein